MDKLLLTLTLVAFSSGVLGNASQNLTEGGPTGDSVVPRTKVLGGHVEYKSCVENAPDDYQVINPAFGAHKLYKQPALPWGQAQKICIADGGDLAVIKSRPEAELLLFFLQKEKIAQAWIGIHDQFEHGHWVTTTGESLASTGADYWLPGKPKYPKGNEDCGAFDHSGGFTNLACDHWRSYFCKINLC